MDDRIILNDQPIPSALPESVGGSQWARANHPLPLARTFQSCSASPRLCGEDHDSLFIPVFPTEIVRSKTITMSAMDARRQQALGLALIALMVLVFVLVRRWWSTQ